jgi:hypothetical protein
MKPETKQLLLNLGVGIGLLSFVGLLLWGVWYVVRLPALTIDQVLVTGGETISHELIQTEVEAELEGEYWQFVPRRFAWTYPYAEIIAVLQATPRVRDPQLERQGKALRVTLAEYEPVALWCNDDTATSTACVFLDDNGYGFAAAPTLEGGTFIRFVRDGQSATTSAVFADGDDFAQLRELEALLEAFGWPVARIEFDQARDAFMFLVGGGELKVSLLLSPTETVENLTAVLSAEAYQHFLPGNFEYIDLRFGNKVFVSEFGAPEESVTPDMPYTESAATTSVTALETDE